MANLQLPLNQNHESKQNSQFSFESCAAVLFVCLPFSFVLKTSIVIFKGEIAYFDKGQKILFLYLKSIFMYCLGVQGMNVSSAAILVH